MKRRIAENLRRELEGGDMQGAGEYLQPAMPYGRGPKLSIEIQKQDNGFTLQLIEPPDPSKEEEEYQKEAEANLEDLEKKAEEMIDKAVEGMVAFIRHIQDKSTGEEWKEGDDKEKMRAGFKAFFRHRLPSFVPRGQLRRDRSENMVFASKEELLAYLAKNL
jgi:hypothetical protein